MGVGSNARGMSRLGTGAGRKSGFSFRPLTRQGVVGAGSGGSHERKTIRQTIRQKYPDMGQQAGSLPGVTPLPIGYHYHETIEVFSKPPMAGRQRGELAELTRRKARFQHLPPVFWSVQTGSARRDGFHREFQGRQPLAVGFPSFNISAQTAPWPSAPPTRTSNGTSLWPRPARAPSVRHSVLSTSCSPVRWRCVL